MNSKDYRNIREAYLQVYAPQELTEEQVWEEVEYWVNSLLEEGYDLSDYTWEEMYESYRGTSVAGQAPTETDAIEPKFGVDKTGIKPLTTFTKPAALTPMDQFAKANPRLAAAQAEKDRIRGTSQSDNPLMKDMKDRMPMTPSVQSPTLAKDLGGDSGNQSLLDNPNASKAATPKKTPITSGFDMFDVVKGYLIGEGYADTEEAALAIMANMSEDWKYSIMESMLDFLPKTKTVISNKPEDKRNPLQKYSDATKPLFAGLPQGKTVTQKPQPRGREFTNPPS